MIKNIIFDMGNVLLDYNPNVCLDHFLESDTDKKMIMDELFQGSEWVKGDMGLLTDEEIYLHVKKRLPKRLHSALKNCVFEWHMCMKPIAGAKEFCEYARSEGYKIYVLSNASNTFYDYFPKNFAPLSYFDGVVVSSDIHMIKPEQEIYTYLFEKYRLVPEECFFIDDRQENIEGARAAHMNGAVFNGDFQEMEKTIINLDKGIAK
ncbi:MAG: HAD family hydrolase [Lachnospiraceae bacterium]